MSKRNLTEQPDALDRILLESDALLPSSGFAASVLEAVQRQAAAPTPIPFPWSRALPGLAALLLSLAVVIRFAVQAMQSPIQNPVAVDDWLKWFQSSEPSAILLRNEAAPVLAALAASCICVLLCRKLIARTTS
jgi:hypothetical protein